MQIYLVGGAVRDKYLGLAQKDRDWLVVGATPNILIQQGFQQVGKDFPVFLHPKTKEEYALARTEKKQGQGYTGFICDFSPHITLEEDLKRRDLTINAMAENSLGELFDPYGGMNDLQHKILRHVSDAFSEDPLRILRVARFFAYLSPLGFSIAPETKNLITEMVAQGELKHLTAERVWQETEKALTSDNPLAYFQMLYEVNALEIWFPEFCQLINSPAPIIEKIFSFSVKNLPKALIVLLQFCAFLNAQEIKSFCSRLKTPQFWKKMMINYQLLIASLSKSPTAEDFLTLLNQLDPWRNPEHFHQLMAVYSQLSKNNLRQSSLLTCFNLAQQVDIQAIIQAGFQKSEIKNELNRQRLAIIDSYLSTKDIQ